MVVVGQVAVSYTAMCACHITKGQDPRAGERVEGSSGMPMITKGFLSCAAIRGPTCKLTIPEDAMIPGLGTVARDLLEIQISIDNST